MSTDPEPYMMDVTLRVPVALWQQFHAACLAHQTIPSTLVRTVIEDALRRWEADDAVRLPTSARLLPEDTPVPELPPRSPTAHRGEQA